MTDIIYILEIDCTNIGDDQIIWKTFGWLESKDEAESWKAKKKDFRRYYSLPKADITDY